MPKSDPSAWREAREMWETSEMSLSDVAARLDVAIPTVSIRAKRECWVKSDVVSLDRLSYTPKQLVEIAVRSLVRAASQTRDLGASVKASSLLLDRMLGRVVHEMPPPDAPKDNEMPAWLEARRLLYQEAVQQGRAPLADDADPTQPLPEPSARPALRSVPSFFDGPTRPSS